jgi:mono/diheme cytochrome c family protein
MKKMIAFFAAGMVLGLGFMAWNVKGIEASEYQRGKDIYENKCQICHGVKGDGNGPAGAALSPKPVDFTSPKFWQQKNVDKLITDTVENGHGMMPSFDLKPGEIKDIIDYLAHTFKPKS